jgi:hypothetical protein
LQFPKSEKRDFKKCSRQKNLLSDAKFCQIFSQGFMKPTESEKAQNCDGGQPMSSPKASGSQKIPQVKPKLSGKVPYCQTLIDLRLNENRSI